jgi:chemotaxis protein MotB
MSRRSARALKGPFDYWPGFVDVLSTLLLVITFMLSIFMLAQWFLGQQISSQEQALSRLQAQLAQLSEQLGLKETERLDLLKQIEGLRATLTEEERKASESAAAAAAAETAKAGAEVKLTSAEAQLALLNQQMTALRDQLLALQAALDASEAKNKDAELKLEDLGARLNEALAVKVKELSSYRSEFFGRLREILGGRADIRVEGDRFVFQSEVLFDVGVAKLSGEGAQELSVLADALKELDGVIPPDIDWVLRVDGHADKRPVNTPEFPSNLHLSAARAIAVVDFLKAMGVPSNRLIAAGFGAERPVDTSGTEEGFSRNRRIEFKLTEP